MTKKGAIGGDRDGKAARASRPTSKKTASRHTSKKSAPPHRTEHAAHSTKVADKKSESSASSEASQTAGTLPDTRYLFFGGKGGVGKTTAACAAALLLLDRAADGERILLFSTDPAHSLSDSLGTEIGDRLVEVARRGKSADAPLLFAREMDAARALEEFKNKHRGVLAEIADRGTMLDEADINDLLDLSLPGMDEVMALFELSEVERADAYARVVVDTAPTGHTARMLRLPEVFTRWIGALDRMSEKHRYMVAHFVRGRAAREDEVDRFLRDLSERVRAARAMLFDAKNASFTLVTIPEALAVEESARYLRTLREEGAPVTDLVVNRVEHKRGACPFCRARAAAQTRWLTRLESDFKPLRLRRVPLFPGEVRGPEALRRFARATWGDEDKGEKVKGREGGKAFAPPSLFPSSPLPLFPLPPRRLLVFGGKGGVGKTTAAAAAALALARSDEKARVLCFSIDPAHSLSDSFDEEVGELKRGVAGLKNLDAMEIDPARRFEELKERYRAWTDELFESLTGGSRFEVRFDREAMRELVSLAPPGIDEIAALSTISDLVEDGSYTTIVLDTAPTGHLLRFLELPEVALAWVRTFIKLLLKYKNVVRWGGVAEELVALSKSIKRVAALLADPVSTEFVGVAIPERMSLEETARLAESLTRLRVPLKRLLINNVVTAEAAAGCDFCDARRRSQTGVVKEFKRRLGRAAELYAAPQQPHEVRGPKLLREHFERWAALD